MTPFYVSDTYSLQLPGDAVWHPGSMNSDAVYGPGQHVRAHLWSASLDLAVLNFGGAPGSQSGIAVDIQLEFYDISQGAPARPQGIPLGFASPYGGAPNGQIINHSAEIDRTPVARRDWVISPLIVEGVTPNVPGGYQLGALVTFHNGIGPVHGHIQYHLHGASELVGAAAAPAEGVAEIVLGGMRYEITMRRL